MRHIGQRFAWLVGVATLGGAMIGPGSASAQSPSPDEIVEALKPRTLNRSLSLGAPAPRNFTDEDAALIDGLSSGRTRSLSAGQRERLAKVSAMRPKIDLDVPFDFNSSRIGPSALPVVRALGTALTRPELQGGTYVIAGHTDAKGRDQYNRVLSARRANAVKAYLVKEFSIPQRSLIAIGYGKDNPKNPSDPLAAENRRVEATNVSDIKSASR